jgi:hypothetical protein
MKQGRPRKTDREKAVRLSVTLDPVTAANIKTHARGSMRKALEKAFAKPAKPIELRWEDYA